MNKWEKYPQSGQPSSIRSYIDLRLWAYGRPDFLSARHHVIMRVTSRYGEYLIVRVFYNIHIKISNTEPTCRHSLFWVCEYVLRIWMVVLTWRNIAVVLTQLLQRRPVGDLLWWLATRYSRGTSHCHHDSGIETRRLRFHFATRWFHCNLFIGIIR